MTDGIKRRDFLKVLGVSGAGATLTGCSTEQVERFNQILVEQTGGYFGKAPKEDVVAAIQAMDDAIAQAEDPKAD